MRIWKSKKMKNRKNRRLPAKSRIDQLGHWYVKANATENADVDDDAYYDGAQTTRAIDILQELKTQINPSFFR